MADKNGPNYQVRAVTRAFEILNAFSVTNPELSLTEISDVTKLNKSTLIRLLSCMEEDNFIEQNAENDKYHLGIKTFEVGMVYYLTQLQVNQAAKPVMADLVNKINMTINLAVFDQGDIVYIGIEEPNKIMRVQFSLGARTDFHCTSLGKVIAASMSERKVDQLFEEKGLKKYTEKTITDPQKLKEHLELVRKQGYAEDIEELMEGVRCVAVPIHDYSGKVVAAMSASGTIFEMTEENAGKMISELKKAAAIISGKLGYNSHPGMVQL